MRRTVKEALKRKRDMEAKTNAPEKTTAKANALVTETITEQPTERAWAKRAKVDDDKPTSLELDPVKEQPEAASSDAHKAEVDSEEPPVTQVIYCKLKRRQETDLDEEPAEASSTSEVVFDGAEPDAEIPEVEVGSDDLPMNIENVEEPVDPPESFKGKCLIYSEDQERKEEDASDGQWQDDKLLIVRLCMVGDDSYLRNNARNPDGTFRSLISLKAHNYEETDPGSLRVTQYEWNRLEERLYNMKLKSHFDSKGRLAGWVSERIQVSIEL